MSEIEALLDGLNDAQREAVLATEGPVLIIAGAGSGKTRVITSRVGYLIGTGRALPPQIVAVTFTNKAAGEMKERIVRRLGPDAGGARIGTFHALCLRVLRRDGRRLGISSDFQVYDTADQAAVIKAILKEAQIDEAELSPRAILARISHAKNEMVSVEAFRAKALLPDAKIVALCYGEYTSRLRKLGGVDFDDLILEALRLLETERDVAERYARATRYLLVDEYQDTNQVQYRLIRALSSAHRNVTVVGDEDQCLAKGTLVTMADGARKPIEEVRSGDRVLSCYGSGDFRPALVSAVFRRRSRREGKTIRTAQGRFLTSTAEHVHFAGYRLGVAPQTYFTYLMYKRSLGYRLGTSRVYTRSRVKPVVGFRQRALQEHADALWVLSTHTSENDARAEETILSLTYQIPTLPFVPRKGGSTQGLVHDGAYIQRVFRTFDTARSAARLLETKGLSADHPHHVPQSRTGYRRNLVVTLCGDHRGATPMHRIAMCGNDPEGRRALESLGLSVRPAKSGSRGWRFETVNKDYAEVMRSVERIRTVLDVNIVRNARFGRNGGAIVESNSLPFLPASNVHSGMLVFDGEGCYDAVQAVEDVSLDEHVFDLNIEATHNFIANGIVTHNSIFSWRGADIRNIQEFESDYPDARLMRLERNYRSTKTILRAASSVIEKNERRHPKTLWTENDEGLPIHYHRSRDDRDEGEAIARIIASLGNEFSGGEIGVLYRTNNQSRLIEEALVRAGIPYRIVGSLRFYERKEIKDLLAYLRLLLSPHDDPAFARAVNTPARGIGKTTLDQLAALAAERGTSLHGATRIALDERLLPTRADGPLRKFTATLAMLREQAGIGAADVGSSEALAASGRMRRQEDEPGASAEEPEAREAVEPEETEPDEADPDEIEAETNVIPFPGNVWTDTGPEHAMRGAGAGGGSAREVEARPGDTGADDADGEGGTEREEGLFPAGRRGMPIVPVITALTRAIGFDEHLEKTYPGDHEDRLENIEALVSAAAEYDEQSPGGGLQGFLDRTSLRSDTDDVQGERGVTLLTIHSAKGLEFSAVILAGLEEHLFPHIRSSESAEEMEEERRLCYVALTRAKKRLVLTNAVMRRSFGDFVENPPSRFIDEIPAGMIVYSESSPWSGVVGDPLRSAGMPGERTTSPSGFMSPAGTGGPASARGTGTARRAGGGEPRRSGPGGGGARRAGSSPGGWHGRVSAASQITSSADAFDDFAVGRIVTHPMFGRGMILHKEGAGDSLKLTIRFQMSGTRKILPRHTTLVVHD